MDTARPTTRDRLLDSASRLFASNGYRGASVRDICNLAQANPGAVSYHFGGKRQLYRAVLRQAAQSFASVFQGRNPTSPARAGGPALSATVAALYERVHEDPQTARLLLRDLADGGAVAVEALAPALRAALAALRGAGGDEDVFQGGSASRLLLLELAAPLFLLSAAWPVLEGALELETSQRQGLLAEMVERVLGRSNPPRPRSPDGP